jgi:hypothetical protein
VWHAKDRAVAGKASNGPRSGTHLGTSAAPLAQLSQKSPKAGLQLTFDLDAERVDSLLGVEVLALPATAITGLQLTRSSPRLLPIFHVRLRTDAIASP